MTKSEIITRLRKRARLQRRTYEGVCIAAGVFRQALWQWTLRKTDPKITSIIAVAEELGLELVLREKQ